MKAFFKWVFIFLGIVFLLSLIGKSARWETGEELKLTGKNLAVIELEGVIMDSLPVLEQIKTVTETDALKGVVVRVNSPGGSVGASQEIYLALKKLREKKPVVISMGDVAASGGLYAALGGQHIFALPGTLTGSVGVLLQLTNISKLLEKIHVEPVTIRSGTLKDAGNPLHPMSPEARKYLETTVVQIFDHFKTAVKEERKLDEEAMTTLSDGRAVDGATAKALKLVDELGTFDDAVEWLRQKTGAGEKAELAYLSRKPKSWLDRALETQSENLFQKFVRTTTQVIWYRWEPAL